MTLPVGPVPLMKRQSIEFSSASFLANGVICSSMIFPRNDPRARIQTQIGLINALPVQSSEAPKVRKLKFVVREMYH